MARKIGFSRPDTEAKKSIADSYLDEFRQRHNHDLKPDPYATAPKRKRNWFAIVFLGVWLTAWSCGITVVAGVLLAGKGEPFLYFWLAAASVGWVIAVYVLLQQIKGKPVSKGTNG